MKGLAAPGNIWNGNGVTLPHFPDACMHVATWEIGKNLQRDFWEPRGMAGWASTQQRAATQPQGQLQQVPPKLPRLPGAERRASDKHGEKGICLWVANPCCGETLHGKVLGLVFFCFLVLVLNSSCRAMHQQALGATAMTRLSSPSSEGFSSAWKQCLTQFVIRLYDFLLLEDNKTKIRIRFKNIPDAYIHNKIHMELL